MNDKRIIRYYKYIFMFKIFPFFIFRQSFIHTIQQLYRFLSSYRFWIRAVNVWNFETQELLQYQSSHVACLQTWLEDGNHLFGCGECASNFNSRCFQISDIRDPKELTDWWAALLRQDPRKHRVSDNTTLTVRVRLGSFEPSATTCPPDRYSFTLITEATQSSFFMIKEAWRSSDQR